MLHDLRWRSLGDRRLDQRLIIFLQIVSGLTFVETESILRKGDVRTGSENGFKIHTDSHSFQPQLGAGTNSHLSKKSLVVQKPSK